VYKLFILVLMGVLLSACVHSNKIEIPSEKGVLTDPAADWASDAAYFTDSASTFADTHFWRFDAKIGLRSNSISEQANVVWQASDRNNSVRIFGPLGVGTTRLEFNADGVSLRDKNGVVHKGRDAQTLLTRIIGWPLPIDALSNWLFLHPDLSKPFQYLVNEEGQLVTLRQFGWQIEYSDYRDYQGRSLPRKLFAIKEFQNSALGLVSVKLVTKSWQW
jgi:outer membrane lipoprotein LolB